MTQEEARQRAHELLGPSKCGPFTFDESGKSGRCKALCLRLQANEMEHAREKDEWITSAAHGKAEHMKMTRESKDGKAQSFQMEHGWKVG